MYSTDQIYKIQTTDNIFYTGHITEEDNTFIKVQTLRGETLILNKNNIARSIIINQEESKRGNTNGRTEQNNR